MTTTIEKLIVRFSRSMKRQRYIGASKKGSFFPPSGTPFELVIGSETVLMEINEWSRMKPVHAIWSQIEGLRALEANDLLIFTRDESGVYHMKRRIGPGDQV